MEKEDLIFQQINKLENRCDDLDKRMRSFETSVKALVLLAIILGIGAGYGGLVLKESKNQLSSFQSTLAQAQPAIDSVARLQEQIAILNKEAGPRADNLDSRAADQALLERIDRFESTPAPKPYAWDGYFADMSGLRDLAVEYVTLAAQDPKKVSAADLNACFDELLKAADIVKSRAKDGLKTTGTEWYALHWNDKPEDFKHLLRNLKQDDESGALTSSQIGCYQIAFPNWVANNGAFVNSPYNLVLTDNPPDCLKRLRISR